MRPKSARSTAPAQIEAPASMTTVADHGGGRGDPRLRVDLRRPALEGEERHGRSLERGQSSHWPLGSAVLRGVRRALLGEGAGALHALLALRVVVQAVERQV